MIVVDKGKKFMHYPTPWVPIGPSMDFSKTNVAKFFSNVSEIDAFEPKHDLLFEYE